jgi:iron complex outermembrane receptor protein
VYTVKPNINVYALYTQGYNPQDAAVQSDTASGGPFDPLESNMVEAGVKTEWFNRRLTITTAVYRIKQRNSLYDAATADRPFLKTQIGKEESKGFEVDVAGQIASNWNVVLNYAFNEAAITDAGKADLDIKGRQKPNAPKHQGNVWTKYNFLGGALKGLGISMGANFVTRRYVSLSKTQSIPGYEIANAALYYKVNRVQLQFNLNNIFNNTYWVGGYDYLRLFPGAPRNWLATVAYTF